uniref:Uncharacterized protein n=1 Tax=Glossina pallidipes TaxID=7398 RepID=A0A1A9ZET8_GLOPL
MNNSAFLSNNHYTAYQIIPIDNFHAQNTFLALMHILIKTITMAVQIYNSIVDYAGNASLDKLMCEALVHLYPLETYYYISSQDNDDNDELWSEIIKLLQHQAADGFQNIRSKLNANASVPCILYLNPNII